MYVEQAASNAERFLAKVTCGTSGPWTYHLFTTIMACSTYIQNIVAAATNRFLAIASAILKDLCFCIRTAIFLVKQTSRRSVRLTIELVVITISYIEKLALRLD
jgi:hypothetical protein